MNDSKPTFKEAMEATLFWCKSWEDEEISDEVFSDRVRELLETVEGARGFFVISLSSDCSIIDRLPDPLLYQFRSAGERVVDLLVKNLAMSSAMALKHNINNNCELKIQSERIRNRCIDLLRLLETTSVKKRLETLLNATQGIGPDVTFLKKWGYDKDQIKVIEDSILKVPT